MRLPYDMFLKDTFEEVEIFKKKINIQKKSSDGNVCEITQNAKVKFQNTCNFVDRSITKDNLEYLVAAFMLICFYFKLIISH